MKVINSKRLLGIIVFLFFSISHSLLFCEIWKPPKEVREIAVPTLPDIAMAAYDAFGPVIYFNPNLTIKAGLLFTMFTRAHEYGHIYRNHIQKQMFVANPYAKMALSQEQELEADCFATKQLCNVNRDAILEAIKIFELQGPISISPTHPPGTIRANNINSCFKECKNTKENVSPVSFEIEIPYIRRGELGGIIEIFIDGESVGTISNFSEDYDTSKEVDSIEPGFHQYRLKVKIYSFYGYDPIFQRTITGSGTINIEDNDTFIVINGASNPQLAKE